MKRATDYQIVSFAIGLLRTGTLPSALPEQLISEYGLSPERAGELASRATEIHQKPSWQSKPGRPGKRGKLGTKPLDQEPGE